jgi:uncharacterized protein (TIGR02996 family)
MNAEESALIAAVVAAPDDDTPRLVYADWLDEHGRQERARLIRFQCQIEILQAEETTLLEQHARAWGRELFANGACWWKFHRGFPEEIGISTPDFIAEHQNLNAITPLRRLHLTIPDDDSLTRLSSIVALQQVQSLEIGRDSTNAHLSGGYGSMGLNALIASKHLGGLRRLDLHSRRLGEADAIRLSEAMTFSRLNHLTLSVR